MRFLSLLLRALRRTCEFCDTALARGTGERYFGYLFCDEACGKAWVTIRLEARLREAVSQ